jgi:signal transduction histidine kinase
LSAASSLREPWIDDLTEGIVLIDGGRIRVVNARAAEMLDVDADGVFGLPMIAVLKDHRLERAYLENTQVELTTRGRALQARPITGGLALRDISALREIRSSSRELLAILSHELRTPVTTIRATIEALHYDLSEEERRGFLAQAESECQRLVRLLEDLTVDVKPPRERSVPLSEVCERVRTVLTPILDANRISLEVDVGELIVWADPDKVLQVVINLVENAAMYGPDGAEVTISARLEPNRPEMVRVVVKDLGVPLEAEMLGRLFAPHVRGNGSIGVGSGLGLYIVRSIARRWGGEAWASPLPSGNEFGVLVPAKVRTN